MFIFIQYLLISNNLTLFSPLSFKLDDRSETPLKSPTSKEDAVLWRLRKQEIKTLES